MAASQVLNLPPAVLSEIPILTPPPGIQPNLVNPEDKGFQLTIIASIFLAIGLIAFTIREYAKIFVVKKRGWDDVVLTLGMVLVIVVYVGNILGVVDGPGGKHGWDTSAAEQIQKTGIIANYLAICFLTPALLCIKLSVYLMYYQIFWPMRWLRICVYIGATVTCGFYAAISIYLFVFETPRPGVPWQVWTLDPEIAKNLRVSVPTGAMGIATDTALILLPIPAVVKLKLPNKKKIGIILVFMTGLGACVASVLGTYYRVKQERTQDWNWYTPKTESLIQIEMNCGIICVSMPMISRVFTQYFPAIKGYRSKLQSRITLLRAPKSRLRMVDSTADVRELSHEEV